ncbi:MAG: DNA adenine methylase [Peptoniphilus lacrimalis]|uniref:DNA adenine methylase n=1 Tax=Peptoniphilus lacrimalis TaxID=33031 RepID=UPI00254D9455|nr:DNA adenine methylase [Peptoniphilus lacrimalis]MDK8281603.1 DNA adenine methylase [Peptoniphilus lacrimalis]
MPYQIWNRRYTGSKYKLAEWITDLIAENCVGNSFCDLFAGTAIMSKQMIDSVGEIYINDFLYSNEVIYKAFFEQSDFDYEKLNALKKEFSKIQVSEISENYVSVNFGNKFFSYNDSLRIGFIREQIEKNADLNEKEKNILLASLLYSLDKAANTVGHYDAYIKGKTIKDSFVFDLITPYEYENKKVHISRTDANQLVKKISCDIVYIDPPYNSRQYSRFYHILENITKWEKPELFGTACKPKAENMSEYCRSSATKAFEDLIDSLKCKYIVVSYNNTYNSKSSSSKNKITLEDIQNILESKGTVSMFEKEHQYFNAGKTELPNHKELVFIMKVGD